jgi:signal recognition particle receptor subunit beta
MSGSGGYTDFLLIGAEGVGKTVLLRTLRHLDDPKRPPSSELYKTYPTTGTEMETIVHKRDSVSFREMGGSISPVWPKYFDKCGGFIFVIDLSHNAQVSCAAVELMLAMSSPELSGKPALIVINKLDLVPSPISAFSQLAMLLRFEDLEASSAGSLDVIQTSAWTGEGCRDVIEWCVKAKATMSHRE